MRGIHTNTKLIPNQFQTLLSEIESNPYIDLISSCNTFAEFINQHHVKYDYNTWNRKCIYDYALLYYSNIITLPFNAIIKILETVSLIENKTNGSELIRDYNNLFELYCRLYTISQLNK